MTSERSAVRLEPWGEGDLPLLEQLNAPEMTEHLGGPETADKVSDRQRRYEGLPSDQGRVFKVVQDGGGDAVGSVVYWKRAWDGEEVIEIGWAVLPAYQGRGIAGAAVAQAIDAARSDGWHRFLYAFPGVENAPSNAICRKLGFEMIGEIDFEYPKNHNMRCNAWRLELSTPETG